ncbi:unnamed protein product [Withania somnifera]
MEIWFIIVVTHSISFFLKSLFKLITAPRRNSRQDPYSFPVIGRLLGARRPFADLAPMLRDLKAKYGPLITLNIGSRPAIFIASHSLAYQASVQQAWAEPPFTKGASIFFGRPRAVPTGSNNTNSTPYSPRWGLLLEMNSEILHPSHIKSYSKARSWVLCFFLQHLRHAQDVDSVRLIDHFQYAILSLLVLMYFRDKIDESQIKQIDNIQRKLFVGIGQFNFFPGRKRNIFIPLIEARSRAKEQKLEHGDEFVVAYVDTLLNLELLEENRKLNHREIATLCSEFLSAGTDMISTALQWVMVNLVKNSSIQEKLYQEIASAVGEKQSKLTEEVMKEEDLQKMPYLRAVILEGLRCHPPGHFLLPRKVTEVELNGYVIPKDATINFMVAEIGLDPNVWEDPLEFRPERFLVKGSDKEDFDIKGSREVKMMPFGAGRRICPGYALAMLHLEYFVANLVWHFQWKPVEGDDVDLTEKPRFIVMMKNPPQARICPRVDSV